MKTIVFAGSFDPITNGHLDIIQRLSQNFEKVVVLIAISIEKPGLFSIEERRKLIETCLSSSKNVQVEFYKGLTVNYMKAMGYSLLARGLRSGADLESEMSLAQMNRTLHPEVETFFLPTDPKYSYVASRYIKEVAQWEGAVRFCTPSG